jgi:site-specific DNA-methyltransferase (cytosine-N4-specific)
VSGRVLVGDCRTILPTLRAESVDCVVTSPPYWGLRDYGTATWEGGDPGCDHLPLDARRGSERRTSTLGGGVATITAQESTRLPRVICPRCGASRTDAQLGLEPTPEEYVADMVDVFREVRRVLKPTGTVWLNLGDSYNNTAGNQNACNERRDGTSDAKQRLAEGRGPRRRLPTTGLKPKDLVGIPWRVAFALQADGWYLRSDIIWAKPNPMPESVTDRPTKAHEYIFLLTKSARYYYDADAIAEPAINAGKVVSLGPKSLSKAQATGSGITYAEAGGNAMADSVTVAAGRNRRTVWTVATQPYAEAHFATFPEALVVPCILAGCPQDGVVLDPFLGSGTVAMVASGHGRDWIGIELSPTYADLARERIGGLLCEAVA